jgi:hypothetical protein
MCHFCRAESFDPANFCLGDIVEIQVSFMAIKSNDQYRMKSILRSIALLDDTYTQARHPIYPYYLLFIH